MNILILEDDKNVLDLLKILLTEEGHTVRGVRAVLPAFEILRKGITDVVIMDMGLPRLDGVRFTQKLKKYSEFEQLPIIAITGTPREFLEHNALKAGCEAYLEKPINSRELLKLLGTIEKRLKTNREQNKE